MKGYSYFLLFLIFINLNSMDSPTFPPLPRSNSPVIPGNIDEMDVESYDDDFDLAQNYASPSIVEEDLENGFRIETRSIGIETKPESLWKRRLKDAAIGFLLISSGVSSAYLGFKYAESKSSSDKCSSELSSSNNNLSQQSKTLLNCRLDLRNSLEGNYHCLKNLNSTSNALTFCKDEKFTASENFDSCQYLLTDCVESKNKTSTELTEVHSDLENLSEKNIELDAELGTCFKNLTSTSAQVNSLLHLLNNTNSRLDTCYVSLNNTYQLLNSTELQHSKAKSKIRKLKKRIKKLKQEKLSLNNKLIDCNQNLNTTKIYLDNLQSQQNFTNLELVACNQLLGDCYKVHNSTLKDLDEAKLELFQKNKTVSTLVEEKQQLTDQLSECSTALTTEEFAYQNLSASASECISKIAEVEEFCQEHKSKNDNACRNKVGELLHYCKNLFGFE